MKILQINTSARTRGAHSTRLADAIRTRLVELAPEAQVEILDLASDPHPVLDEAALAALATPVAQRTAQQAARVALDDARIAQLQWADVVVIGAPMYNFGISVQMKTWIDAVARAGVTFRYTASGPEGLLGGRKVYLALARGGLHRGTPNDAQVPHLQAVLGFLGMTDLELVYAEGLAMGEEIAAKSIAQALDRVAAIGVEPTERLAA